MPEVHNYGQTIDVLPHYIAEKRCRVGKVCVFNTTEIQCWKWLDWFTQRQFETVQYYRKLNWNQTDEEGKIQIVIERKTNKIVRQLSCFSSTITH